MIVALVDARLAEGWKDAITMPADLALNLLRMRTEMMKPADEKKDRSREDKVTNNADGSKSMSFGSIEGLAAALAGSGWSGVKIGRD